MKSVLYPPAQALLSYHHFGGAQPTHVYLAGIGQASTGTYPSIIYGSPLAAYHTLMPDFLGFGYSDRPDDFSYSVADHARSLAFLLDSLQASHCTLVGHSFGGAVAITLATMRPDLVARLALAEPVLDGGAWFGIDSYTEEQYIASGFAAVVIERFSKQALAYEPGNRAWLPMLKLTAPHAFYRTALSLAQGAQPTWRQQIYDLRIPRLYIWGEQTYRQELAQPLAANGIKVAVIANAGHSMMWDNPQAFVRAIADFEAG